MSRSINKLHMLPRLTPGGGNYALRRGTILDTDSLPQDVKVKVFPGPGQNPAAADGGTSYSPPDDWIPEGFVLRRPQVVWITAHFNAKGPIMLSLPNDPFQVWTINTGFLSYDGTVTNPFGSPLFGLQNNSYVGTTNSNGFLHLTHVYQDLPQPGPNPPPVLVSDVTIPGDTQDPWYSVHLVDPYKIAEDSLAIVFASVQASIASSRPGLTWVDLPTFSDPGDQPATKIPLYTPHLGPVMSDSYFGTNFLHITIGFPLNPLTFRSAHEPLDEDEVFLTGLGLIPGFAADMAGYSVRMYSINIFADSGSTFVFPSCPPLPAVVTEPAAITDLVIQVGAIPPPIVNVEETRNWSVNDGHGQVGEDPSGPVVTAKIQANLLAQTDALNATIDGTNANRLLADGETTALVEDFSAQSLAAGGDYVYEGNEGNLLTLLDIDDLIREHYGY